VGVSRFEMNKICLSEFNNNEFELNRLFKCSNTSLIFVWKSIGLKSVIITLISSVKRTGREILLKILGELFTYIKKSKSPRIDP